MAGFCGHLAVHGALGLGYSLTDDATLAIAGIAGYSGANLLRAVESLLRKALEAVFKLD